MDHSKLDRTKEFAGFPVVATTVEVAASDLLERATVGPPTTYRLVNAGTLDAARRDHAYQEVLRGPGVNLPDGRPLASVLRRTAPTSVPCEQVRGPSFFERCLDLGRAAGAKHFLLGSTPSTLEELVRRMTAEYPGVDIAGTYSPPFTSPSRSEIDEQDRRLRASGANIVWVALGTPKQDIEALRIMHSTGLTTAAVGAAFDFSARTKRSAPGWAQSLHLEWAFRLVQEPRRLWRRYLIGNANFAILSARHLWQRRS